MSQAIRLFLVTFLLLCHTFAIAITPFSENISEHVDWDDDVSDEIDKGAFLANKACYRILRGKINQKGEELAKAEVNEVEKSRGITCQFKRQRSSHSRVYRCSKRKKVIIKFSVTPCFPERMTVRRVVVRGSLF